MGPFGGPSIPGNTVRGFPIPPSSRGIPFTAQAYSLNITVVPQGPLAYLRIPGHADQRSDVMPIIYCAHPGMVIVLPGILLNISLAK